MPNRLNTGARIWAYRFLEERDGPRCQGCGLLPEVHLGHDIDHVDGNSENWNPENIRLLCHRCNMEAMVEKRRKASQPPLFQSRRPSTDRHENQPWPLAKTDSAVVPPHKQHKPSATELSHQSLDYSTGSFEAKANDRFSIPYRTWVIREVEEHGTILRKEAIYGGAEAVGCAAHTAREYLGKLVSSQGPLAETKDGLRNPVIIMKPPIFELAPLTIAQLSRKYEVPETTVRRWRDRGNIGQYNGSVREEDVAMLVAARRKTLKGSQQ